MEEMVYDAEQASAYILGKFTEQGDFLELFSADELRALVAEIVALDAAFMAQSGVEEGGVYDDDAAYEFMHKALCKQHPAHEMYMMRFVDDYLDFNEAYLESIGALEWE